MRARCPAKTGTSGEEYIRFWVHQLECTCKLADDNGASHCAMSQFYPCIPMSHLPLQTMSFMVSSAPCAWANLGAG